MPIFGLDSNFPHANTALQNTFFPRMQKQVYTRMCGLIRSDRYVEPFSLLGAAPLMARFTGQVIASKFNSWKLQVPNILLKSKSLIARADIEFDQGGFIPKAIKAVGVTLAETPSYQLARHMIRGHTTDSCTVTSDVDGQTYNTTFETGIPTFSGSHNMKADTLQSNIVTGNLPATAAALRAQDLATTVAQLRLDVNLLIERIASIQDDQGRFIYSSFDPVEQLVLVVPPILRQAAQYINADGLQYAGTQASGTGTSGSTTSAKIVKDVINFPLLGQIGGIPDVEDASGTKPMITAADQTEYYAYIDDDLVKPYYWQRYVPRKGEDIAYPKNYDPAELANEIVREYLEAGKKITIEEAEWYSAAIVDHNLGAIGSNAQEAVVDTEQFFVSPRQRGCIVEGPWFTKYKIVPTGASV